MEFIIVYCEEDISGNFGGNNNEEVFSVDSSLSEDEVDMLVRSELSKRLDDVDIDGSEDLYQWNYTTIQSLSK